MIVWYNYEDEVLKKLEFDSLEFKLLMRYKGKNRVI